MSAALRHSRNVAAGAVLQHELEAAGRRQPQNRRQAEGECEGFRHASETALRAAQDRVELRLAWSVRSSHGFSVLITVATLELDVPVAISRPPSTKVSSTPGNLEITVSIFFEAASARSVEAPSGSRTEVKNAPWSSFGRKPVGSRLKSPPVSAVTTSSASTASAPRRIRKITPVR